MKISDMLPVQLPPDLGTSTVTATTGLMSSLAGAIDTVGIDSTTAASFLGSAGMMKDGFFAMTNAYSAVNSFKQWMQGGEQPTLSGSALTTLAHGLNAMALCDKVGGTLVGLGSYSGLAGGFVNLAKVVSGVQQGNMTQVVFSGAKLCATVALAGNPVATIAITSAEILYNRYASNDKS
jgi:hypothetical protein